MKNKLIVFTGPSGVGKATVEAELFKSDDFKLLLSVSATTRLPREGEVDGEHYHFITDSKFDNMVENDEFIEWSAHFSRKYGTPKSEIKRIRDLGGIPFLEVETNGAKNILEQFDPSEVVSIFLAPPSKEVLRERIIGRGSENPEQVEERISRLEEEMSYQNLFTYVVVNNTISQASQEILSILKKEL